MQKLSIFFFLLFSISLFGQKTTLSIMGKTNYVEYSDAYTLKLKFEEDPSKCDPVVGFVSIEDQIKHFTESLVAANLALQFKEDDGLVISEFPAKKYSLVLRERDEMEEAIRLAKEQRVEVTTVKFLSPKHDFKDQDARAIKALQDARLKADIYAAHIGKKVTRILYIDDETSTVGLNPHDPYSEKYKRYEEILEKLKGYSNAYQTEYYKETRDGGYGLWVEFELEDI